MPLLTWRYLIDLNKYIISRYNDVWNNLVISAFSEVCGLRLIYIINFISFTKKQLTILILQWK